MIAEYTGTIPKRGDRVGTAHQEGVFEVVDINSLMQTAHRVGTAHQEGVFEVVDINSLMQTAHLKSTDGLGHIMRNIPWTALKFPNRK